MSTTGIVLLSIVSFIVSLVWHDDNIRYPLDSDFVETDEES